MGERPRSLPRVLRGRSTLGESMTREVPVTLYAPPGDTGTMPATGTIADTPANRAALEAAAIPRCEQWRFENPEPAPNCSTLRALGIEGTAMAQKHMHPAPYCCSAYCDRCAGLRALDGEQPLMPNDWMYRRD